MERPVDLGSTDSPPEVDLDINPKPNPALEVDVDINLEPAKERSVDVGE